VWWASGGLWGIEMTDYELERLECLATPATTVEMADREVARYMGAEDPERPWILTDRDVWYPNPFYVGPPVPHSEDDYYE